MCCAVLIAAATVLVVAVPAVPVLVAAGADGQAAIRIVKDLAEAGIRVVAGRDENGGVEGGRDQGERRIGQPGEETNDWEGR